RAKAAAQVLRDFAAEGRQMLVFTCHDHIAKLFRSLKAPVNELPSNTERDPAPLIFDDSPRDRPKKPARPAPAPRKPAKSRLADREEAEPEVVELPQPVVAIEDPPWEAPEPRYDPPMQPVGEVWEEE